jgi:endonuclease I
MKKLSTFCVLVLLTAVVWAQATLPATWNFATSTLPDGWSETNVNGLTQYYSGSGNPAPAYKLDATGDILMIHVATTPGTISYDLTGNSFSGGTFLVEESDLGAVWTTLHTFTAPASGYTNFIDNASSTSRYFRFYYENKVSGNVGIDNVNITAGVSANAEMLVQLGTGTVVNGETVYFNSPVGTNTPQTFSVNNLGLANLNLASASISGPAAADYALATSLPLDIAGQSSSSLVIDFTPSTAGSRNATITIENNDANANPYIIYLYGIGGTLATEPTNQPTALNFAAPRSYRVSGTFTSASGNPDGYVVLRTIGSTVTEIPADGTEYQRGDVIGNAQVVVVGNGTSFRPSGIVANTNYHFAVFAYNGDGEFTNYLTSSPLIGNINSGGSLMPSGYYNGVSTTASSFVTDLHNIVNPHTTQFYSSFGPLMMENFFARDTVDNQRVVTCSYSGLNEIYTQPFDWTTNDFAREHSFPQSWMPTVNDGGFQSRPEYSDYHMIVPANQNNVNGIRSNYPLGVVVTPTYNYLGCKLGFDANGNKVFEPRDADKGDAARCILYQTICYTGVAYTGAPNTDVTYGGSWSLPQTISNSVNYGQDQYVLKMWHYQDPVDNFEIARNDYVDSLQGNRNPFIDNMDYVCYIDFSNMTWIANPAIPCAAAGIGEMKQQREQFMIMPNPSSGAFRVIYNSHNSRKATISVLDQTGRVVTNSQEFLHTGINNINMDMSGIAPGLYYVNVVTGGKNITEKLVIE